MLSWFRGLFAQETNSTREAYKAGRVDRFTKTWRPESRTEDAAINESLELMLRRTRDLYRNAPSQKRVSEVMADLIIGSGMTSFANPLGSLAILDATDDQIRRSLEYMMESDQIWEDWSESEADVRGVSTWQEMERIAAYEMINSGDAIFLETVDRRPGRQIPVSYQLLEKEQFDRSKDRPASPGRPRIVNGIELDRFNRPIGYWVYDEHPDDYQTFGAGNSTRIPAARILHLYVRFRPSQSSGVPWLHAIVQPTRDLDWYLGNELTSAALGAILTFVHKSSNPGADLSLSDGTDPADPYGNDPVRLGSGLLFQGGPDDTFEMAESKRPSRDAGPFIEQIRTEQAIGANISLPRLIANYKGTSYTAARASHLDDEAHFLPLRRFVARKLTLPVRRRVNAMAAGLGLFSSVTPQQFRADRINLQRFDVLGPGREQLDPEKETDAAIAKLRSAQSTLQLENGKRQQHWVKILTQMALEGRVAESLGVVLDFSKGQGGQVSSTTSMTGEDNSQQTEGATEDGEE